MLTSQAIVTGPTGLIGKEVVRHLAKEFPELRITMVARNEERLKAFAFELMHHTLGNRISVVSGDIRDVGDWWDSAVSECYDTRYLIDCSGSWGGLDQGWIYGRRTPYADIQENLLEPLRAVVDLFDSARAYFEHKGDGQIIWAGGSIAAVQAFPNQAEYCALKHATLAWLESLRCEWERINGQRNHADFSVDMILSGLVEGVNPVLLAGMRVEGELVKPEEIAKRVAEMMRTRANQTVTLPGHYQLVQESDAS